MSQRLFAVLRHQTGHFDHSRPLEEQREWSAHAAFMDNLAAAGFFLLVGPLDDGSHQVLLIVRADDADEVARTMDPDPWTQNGMLRTLWIAPWTLRIGALPGR